MYAVIETGGKQYKAEQGKLLEHERVSGIGVGESIKFDRVLLFVDGDDTRVGTPYLDGVKVEGKVQSNALADKVIVYKYKSKKGYRRKQGHRQPYMRTLITAIES
jgi:large subunit ribosomal protein L21